MLLVHRHHDSGDPLETLFPAVPPLLLALAYGLLVARARRRNPVKDWSKRHSASFLTGCVLLGAAVLPPLAGADGHDGFHQHMLQHLIIGMYAPLALVLGAPVTLLLRTLPAPAARGLTALLRGRLLRPVAHPVTALLLSTGSLAVLYGTPLYAATTGEPVLHWLLHTHFLMSGCLFAWIIAGPDPGPSRPGVRARLLVLGVAIAAHATLSQLMYGGLLDIPAPPAEIQSGAELMYYGGDIAELLLAGALVATWRPDRDRPRRTARTAGRPG